MMKNWQLPLGSEEIIYGEKEITPGELLNVENSKQSFIYMDPIPLLKDLHICILIK